MSDPKASKAVIDWLLDAQTPSIRYLTCRDILTQAEDHPQRLAHQKDIMQEGPVPAILAQQTKSGQWPNEHSYYTPKYFSTHWSMMLLAELWIDPKNEQFQRSVDYMLSATHTSVKNQLDHSSQPALGCLWGNILRYVAHSGQIEDTRAQILIEHALYDVSHRHCTCRINDFKACAWGVLRTLWGLSALPHSERTDDFHHAIDTALAFLLEDFELVKANYPTANDSKIHSGWFKLNFPLFYQADILFALRILAELDQLDRPGVDAALDWLETQQQKNGRWRGRSPYRSRTWRELGTSEETSRWVTLQAMTILQRANRTTYIS
ncbi:hypothetical protein KC957_02505 [Candidatus Saccharibacteria bacterium]|nr:hypothetical protein [Candidatus Saccharibacteria bacterium]